MLKRIKTPDYALQKVQDNVDEAIIRIGGGPFLSGTVLKDVVLAASSADNEISHGLSREYQGFVVTKSNAAASVFESPTGNNLRNKRILLRASAAVTVDLYIF